LQTRTARDQLFMCVKAINIVADVAGVKELTRSEEIGAERPSVSRVDDARASRESGAGRWGHIREGGDLERIGYKGVHSRSVGAKPINGLAKCDHRQNEGREKEITQLHVCKASIDRVTGQRLGCKSFKCLVTRVRAQSCNPAETARPPSAEQPEDEVRKPMA